MERSVTELLAAAREGDGAALRSLLDETQGRLRGMAASRLRRRGIQSIEPTELFQMAYLNGGPWATKTAKNTSHFFGLMGHAMKCVLGHHARRASALKRNRGVGPMPLLENLDVSTDTTRADAVAINDAMRALRSHDPGCEEAIRLHIIRGRTLAQTADELGVNIHRVRTNVEYGRAWLGRRLAGEG